jgi:hypothetical protein
MNKFIRGLGGLFGIKGNSTTNNAQIERLNELLLISLNSSADLKIALDQLQEHVDSFTEKKLPVNAFRPIEFGLSVFVQSACIHLMQFCGTDSKMSSQSMIVSALDSSSDLGPKMFQMLETILTNDLASVVCDTQLPFVLLQVINIITSPPEEAVGASDKQVELICRNIVNFLTHLTTFPAFFKSSHNTSRYLEHLLRYLVVLPFDGAEQPPLAASSRHLLPHLVDDKFDLKDLLCPPEARLCSADDNSPYFSNTLKLFLIRQGVLLSLFSSLIYQEHASGLNNQKAQYPILALCQELRALPALLDWVETCSRGPYALPLLPLIVRHAVIALDLARLKAASERQLNRMEPETPPPPFSMSPTRQRQVEEGKYAVPTTQAFSLDLWKQLRECDGYRLLSTSLFSLSLNINEASVRVLQTSSQAAAEVPVRDGGPPSDESSGDSSEEEEDAILAATRQREENATQKAARVVRMVLVAEGQLEADEDAQNQAEERWLGLPVYEPSCVQGLTARLPPIASLSACIDTLLEILTELCFLGPHPLTLSAQYTAPLDEEVQQEVEPLPARRSFGIRSHGLAQLEKKTAVDAKQAIAQMQVEHPYLFCQAMCD